MNVAWVVKESLVITLAVLMISGCSAFMTEIEERALVEEEIIAMSKAGVGSNVIIRKIQVTRSQFSLNTEDIIRLKKEDISDDVIEAMINSDIAAEEVDLERSYSLYDYWFNYYNTFYPAYVYSDPVNPFPYYTTGPSGYPMYRLGGIPGRYYRNFPVGLPRKPYDTYPFNFNASGEKDE